MQPAPELVPSTPEPASPPAGLPPPSPECEALRALGRRALELGKAEWIWTHRPLRERVLHTAANGHQAERRAALATLRHLALSGANRRPMWEHPEARGVLLDNATMWELADPLGVQEALQAIGNLALDADNQKAIWQDERARELLLECAGSADLYQVQRQGLMLLAAIARNRANQKLMWEDGPTRELLLRCSAEAQREDVRQLGLRVLANLAWRDEIQQSVANQLIPEPPRQRGADWRARMALGIEAQAGELDRSMERAMEPVEQRLARQRGAGWRKRIAKDSALIGALQLGGMEQVAVRARSPSPARADADLGWIAMARTALAVRIIDKAIEQLQYRAVVMIWQQQQRGHKQRRQQAAMPGLRLSKEVELRKAGGQSYGMKIGPVEGSWFGVSGKLWVKALRPDGLAKASGQIKVGDYLVSVNQATHEAGMLKELANASSIRIKLSRLSQPEPSPRAPYFTPRDYPPSKPLAKWS